MSEHKYIQDVNDNNFQSTVANGVNLVDFWAAWCMPCQMQTPILEQVGEEFEGKAGILGLNVDENPTTAQKNEITGIPALHLFRDGTLVRKFVGVQSADVIRAALKAEIEAVKAGESA